MQRLEVVKKTRLLIGLLIFAGGQVCAESVVGTTEACSPAGTTNFEIITCANEGYLKIDTILNEQYKALKTGLQAASLQRQLLDAQHAWIKFRDKSCQDVYHSESPGAEAPIAKLSCLGVLTSVRVGELIYLRTGYTSDGFAAAVAAIAKPDSSSRAIAEKSLGGDADYGPEFNAYAAKNCAIVNGLFSEESGHCLRRMRFSNLVR